MFFYCFTGLVKNKRTSSKSIMWMSWCEYISTNHLVTQFLHWLRQFSEAQMEIFSQLKNLCLLWVQRVLVSFFYYSIFLHQGNPSGLWGASSSLSNPRCAVYTSRIFAWDCLHTCLYDSNKWASIFITCYPLFSYTLSRRTTPKIPHFEFKICGNVSNGPCYF